MYSSPSNIYIYLWSPSMSRGPFTQTFIAVRAQSPPLNLRLVETQIPPGPRRPKKTWCKLIWPDIWVIYNLWFIYIYI